MYETYLQNERELDRKYTQLKAIIPPTRGWISVDAQIKSHNRLSLIKVMKALEKDLEGDRKDHSKIKIEGYWCCKSCHGESDECDCRSYNQGLQLSLDKIREFIKLLEKGV